MATKLEIMNLALGHLRERKLASLSEAREPRRVLDDFWDHVVRLCLAEAHWRFSKRVIQIDYASSLTPAFGFEYAFVIQDDHIRTTAISAAEGLLPRLMDVKEEAGYWYANVTPIYVEYVSSNTSYGMDIGKWTEPFVDYVALQLAEQACGRITGNTSLLEDISKRLKFAKKNAKAIDAVQDPPKHQQLNSWALSRRGGGGGDRSPQSGSLIG